MSNRLIWLLIIFLFLFGGIAFFYFSKSEKISSDDKIKNSIQIERNNEIIQKKVILKEIKEGVKNKNTKESSIFDENIEVKKELEKRAEMNFRKKIAKILKINNFENISILEIIWEKNKILINLSTEGFSPLLYIYNKKTKNIKKIDFSIEIIYAKIINNNLYFVTEKWIFEYSINSELKYFSSFSDFIILDWNYIWIIKNSEKSKKTNLNFWEETWDLIILHNPKLNKKRLLYSSEFEIKKILLENNKVIITDEKNKKYLLEY